MAKTRLKAASSLDPKVIAQESNRLQRKIYGLEERVLGLQEELEALQGRCPHPGVEWKETAVDNVESFNCETCGKHETRVREFARTGR